MVAGCLRQPGRRQAQGEHQKETTRQPSAVTSANCCQVVGHRATLCSPVRRAAHEHLILDMRKARTLSRFANFGDHDGISQTGSRECHRIARLQPSQQAAVGDMECHSHRRHPNASFAILDFSGPKSDCAGASVDRFNLAGGMRVAGGRHHFVVLAIQLLKPSAWRREPLRTRRRSGDRQNGVDDNCKKHGGAHLSPSLICDHMTNRRSAMSRFAIDQRCRYGRVRPDVLASYGYLPLWGLSRGQNPSLAFTAPGEFSISALMPARTCTSWSAAMPASASEMTSTTDAIVSVGGPSFRANDPHITRREARVRCVGLSLIAPAISDRRSLRPPGRVRG